MNPRPEPKHPTKPKHSRTGKRAAFHAASGDALAPAHRNQPDQPARPGEAGPMNKAEFYAYCKRTGQLQLFFACYPGG